VIVPGKKQEEIFLGRTVFGAENMKHSESVKSGETIKTYKQPDSNMKIDPFGETVVKDYEKLFKEFGIEKFSAKKVPDPTLTMKRGIIFGQRDLRPVLNCIKNKKQFAVMSGIKPSNYLHIGSKMVVDEIIYFQNHGAHVYYAIADIETLVDNKMPLKESAKYARDNIIDVIALGINPKKAKIYKQSEEINVQKHAFVFSNNVTSNMLKAVYGKRPVGLYMAALTQVGDILLPQIERGKMPVVVPVGVDQDPHIRLTRDVAKKHGLTPPSSTYHKLMGSLTGSPKMSKREPAGMIYLREPVSNARKKIMAAFTGGRDTQAEQKKLGGRPEICKVYELARFGFLDDKALEDVFNMCKSGERLCGECKQIVSAKVEEFLAEHQKKRVKAKKLLEKFLGKD
jgi:tryptophanyl-tRNA synthetase